MLNLGPLRRIEQNQKNSALKKTCARARGLFVRWL